MVSLASPARVYTIEDALRADSLSRSELYRALTGQEIDYSLAGAAHPWGERVNEKNRREVVRIINKFYQGCFGSSYTIHVERINLAFEGRDFSLFSREVGELLASINWD